MLSLRPTFTATILIGFVTQFSIGCATWQGGTIANKPASQQKTAGATKDQEQQAKFASSSKDLKNPRKVHLAYAKWQEHVGNIEDARNSYEFLLSKQPKSADAQLGLARLDLLAGRKAQAEQRFLAALKANPTNPLVMDAVGQFYASQKRYDEAVEILNRGIQADPNSQSIRFHLAVALAKSGDIAASTPHFVRTVGDAEAHYNLGVILYDQGNIAASEAQFQQALLKRPDLEQARTWLGDIQREKESRYGVSTATNRQRTATNSQLASHSRQQQHRPQPRAQVRPASRNNLTRGNGPTIRPASSSNYRDRAEYQDRPVEDPFRQVGPINGNSGFGPSNLQGGHSLPPQQDIPPNMTPQQYEQWKNQLR